MLALLLSGDYTNTRYSYERCLDRFPQEEIIKTRLPNLYGISTKMALSDLSCF